MAGHAHHFLSRLDRLALPHVELALSLYNDADLLRFILAEAAVPEGAPRAAVCLGPPDAGPHLVVTRDGRFVTALGEGMRPYDVPVVSRQDLDFLSGRIASLRERVRDAERRKLSEGHVGDLLRKVARAGPRFTREDYTAIAGLFPWLHRTFFEGAVGSGGTCLDVSRDLEREKHLSRRVVDELLEIGWDAWWAFNHFTVLSGTDRGWDPLRAFGLTPGPDEREPVMLNWVHTRMGVFGGFLRGAWFAGRCGHGAIPAFEKNYVEAQTPTRVMAAGAAMLAMACDGAPCAAEARAILARVGDPDEHDTFSTLKCAMQQLFHELASSDPAERRRTSDDHARHLAVAFARERFGLAPEEIDGELAWTAVAHFLDDIHNVTASMQGALLLLPGAARLRPEAFFVPRALSRMMLPRIDLDLAVRVFSPLVRYRYTPPPVRAAPTPGRNDPCACGSGKKFKRCCLGVKAP